MAKEKRTIHVWKVETELSGVSCSLLDKMCGEALKVHADREGSAEPEKAEH